MCSTFCCCSQRHLYYYVFIYRSDLNKFSFVIICKSLQNHKFKNLDCILQIYTLVYSLHFYCRVEYTCKFIWFGSPCCLVKYVYLHLLKNNFIVHCAPSLKIYLGNSLFLSTLLYIYLILLIQSYISKNFMMDLILDTLPLQIALICIKLQKKLSKKKYIVCQKKSEFTKNRFSSNRKMFFRR